MKKKLYSLTIKEIFNAFKFKHKKKHWYKVSFWYKDDGDKEYVDKILLTDEVEINNSY